MIRSLNGCDTLLLESKQVLGLFEAGEAITTIAVSAVTKLIDKLEGKLSPTSVETLTQGWEPGHPENRGCSLVANMREVVSSLYLAKSLALCMQAKAGSEER